MRDPLDYPKLRWPIDIKVEEHQGQNIILLTCPRGFVQQPLGLIAGVGPIIKEFDGETSREELLKKFNHFGLTEQLLDDLIQLLNKSLFLETPDFYNAELEVKQAYRNSVTREPFLAGLSYAAQGSVLKKQINEFIGISDSIEPIGQNLMGIVAPHIDYRRGGSCYGEAYKHLKHYEHDVYVLLGTAHKYSPHMFHLSDLDFETPLGLLATDKNFVNNLVNRYGIERSYADEILHKNEHSLELQTPFLKTLKESCQVVPILVGSFYEMFYSKQFPHQVLVYEEFAQALTATVADALSADQRVGFISSVDMAHVGQFFGDQNKLNPEFMESIRLRDTIYMQAIKEQNKQALFEHIAQDRDARRVCGFPSMYLFIDVFDRLGIEYSCTIFDYQQAVDYQSDCAVTFAAMGVYI